MCVCVLLKQITLHRYGNGVGEIGEILHSASELGYFATAECALEGERFF